MLNIARMSTMDMDRRTAIAVGLTGASAVLLGAKPSIAATEAKGEEIAPGVHWRVLGEAPSPVQGFEKVRWEELTWQPGAKFGPTTMKVPMICEIIQGPLEQVIEGQAGPKTLETGATYACHVGMVETNENKGTDVPVMRIIRLMPPEG
jgi:hypothetical protein